MRTFRWLLLGVAFVIAPASSWAQEFPIPKDIRVTIGPDGNIRIVDAATGKEIPGAMRLLLGDDKAPAKKNIEEFRRPTEGRPQDPKTKLPGKPGNFEIEVEVGPDGNFRPRVIGPDKKGPPQGNLDQKLD